MKTCRMNARRKIQVFTEWVDKWPLWFLRPSKGAAAALPSSCINIYIRMLMVEVGNELRKCIASLERFEVYRSRMRACTTQCIHFVRNRRNNDLNIHVIYWLNASATAMENINRGKSSCCKQLASCLSLWQIPFASHQHMKTHSGEPSLSKVVYSLPLAV